MCYSFKEKWFITISKHTWVNYILVHENKYAIVYNVYFSSIFVAYFEKNNNYCTIDDHSTCWFFAYCKKLIVTVGRFGKSLEMNEVEIMNELPRESSDRMIKLFNMLYNSAVSFMKSHSLKLSMPEGSMSRALIEGKFYFFSLSISVTQSFTFPWLCLFD